MSKWVIVDGRAGGLVIVPIGPLVDGRPVKASVMCNGLKEAYKFLCDFRNVNRLTDQVEGQA